MKYILLLICAIILSNCDITPRKATAQDNYPLTEYDKTINGMVYHIWYLPTHTTQTGYTVYSVNLTKDALECEYYRKQLKNK